MIQDKTQGYKESLTYTIIEQIGNGEVFPQFSSVFKTHVTWLGGNFSI